jgi:nucleoside-diphosphate-sugar epimerase
VHLGAKRSIPDSFLNPREYFDTNVWGTWRLINQYPEARFVNISSSSALGKLSPYGVSKFLAERATIKHQNCVSLRLFNVFGEGQDTTTVIPNFARAMLNNQEVCIFGDGQQSRDFTYVKDVVNEIKWYMCNELRGVFEVGYHQSVRIIDLFHYMAEYFGYKKSPKFLPAREGDILKSCAEKGDILKGAGFLQGLENTMEWWKSDGSKFCACRGNDGL